MYINRTNHDSKKSFATQAVATVPAPHPTLVEEMSTSALSKSSISGITPRESGDVIVLQEEGASVNHWPLGKIQEVPPGADGLVRVVTVKTAKGTYKRPVIKMLPLFLYDES